MKSLRSLSSRRSGFTITEVMVSMGIMSFIFSFMAYLIFMSSRNAMNIHQQIVSQTAAASAAERVVQTLRNSCFFDVVDDDDPSIEGALIKRIRYGWPGPEGDADKPQWGQVIFVEPTTPGATGRIEIYPDDNNMTTPEYVFRHIHDFGVQFETATRVTLRFSYHYSGFGLGPPADANNDGIPDNVLTGQFVTDVIAKNHHVGESDINYGSGEHATIARL